MRYLASSSHDIRTNLAIETYLMEHADLTEPILYFYINAPLHHCWPLPKCQGRD